FHQLAILQSQQVKALIRGRRLPEAVSLLQRTLEDETRAENLRGVVVTSFNLGRVYLLHRDYESAIAHLEEALEADRRLGEAEPATDGRDLPNHWSRAVTLHQLGIARTRRKEWPAAEDAFARSYDLGDERHRMVLLNTWGKQLFQKGDRAGGREKLESSLR